MASYLRPGISGAPISAQAISGGSIVNFDRTGAAAITEAADTLSAAAALAIAGSAAITEAADTLSAAGALSIAGAAAMTEAADTLSSASALAIAAASSMTEAADTLSSAAAVALVGSASITEATDTLSGASALAIVGQLATLQKRLGISSAPISAGAISGRTRYPLLLAFEAADTLSATATLALAASASIAEAADTLSASAALAIVGQANITEAADTAAAASVRIMRPVLRVIAGGAPLVAAHSGGGARININSRRSGSLLRMRA